jgi:uncharacterized membrane protein
VKAFATLERAVELALSVGVAASAVLLLAGLFAGSPAILRAGVLLLMGTPVARVLVLTAGLFFSGDRRFGLVSLTVLAILTTSAVLALR